MSWPLMIALVAGSLCFKIVGVTALGGAVERRIQPVVALLPAALFAALIAVLTFEEGGDVVLDARAAGVAVGAIAVWRKAPLIVVVILAMAVTAGLRALL